MPSQKRGNLGVLCRKSHSSNSRGNKHHLPPKKEVTWVFSAPSHLQAIREAININALPKSSSLGVFRSKSPPSYSRGNKHQCPPKKEEDWVFSAPSHLQVIQEETDINSLPKKRKLGCSLPQVTFKQFERQ